MAGRVAKNTYTRIKKAKPLCPKKEWKTKVMEKHGLKLSYVSLERETTTTAVIKIIQRQG